MTPLDYLNVMQKSHYFAELSHEQLKIIANLGVTERAAKGAFILKESDQGDTVLLIAGGRVDITVSLVGTAHNEVIASLSEGEVVGEIILLGKTRRTANVVAKDDTTLVKWHASDLLKLFDQDRNIGYIVMRNIAQQIAERLSTSNQVLRNTLTIAQKVAY